jgi:hypothetical protein
VVVIVSGWARADAGSWSGYPIYRPGLMSRRRRVVLVRLLVVTVLVGREAICRPRSIVWYPGSGDLLGLTRDDTGRDDLVFCTQSLDSGH